MMKRRQKKVLKLLREAGYKLVEIDHIRKEENNGNR